MKGGCGCRKSGNIQSISPPPIGGWDILDIWAAIKNIQEIDILDILDTHSINDKSVQQINATHGVLRTIPKYASHHPFHLVLCLSNCNCRSASS